MMSLDEFGPTLARWSSDVTAALRDVDPLWLAVFAPPVLLAAAAGSLWAGLACLLIAGVTISLAAPADPLRALPQAVAAAVAALLVAWLAWSLRRWKIRWRTEMARSEALGVEVEETRAALEREVFARVLRQVPGGLRRTDPASNHENRRASP